MSRPSEGIPRVYRDQREALVSAAVGILLVAALVSHSMVEYRHISIIMLVELALAVVISVVACRFFVAGLHVNADGVLVVNPFKASFVAWDQVAGFSASRYGRWAAVATLHLRDGRSIAVIGVRAPSQRSARRVEHTVADLNRRVRSSRTKARA